MKMSHIQFGSSHPAGPSPASLPSAQLLMTGSAPPTTVATSCCENGRPIMTDPHTGQTVCSCQYSSMLSAAYSRVPGITDSMYSSAYAAQGYVPLGADPSALYPQLGGSSHSAAYYPYDPAYMGFYANGYGADFNPAHRKNATREATNTLKAWLQEHIKNPYPTKGEKIMLAIITKMTLTQVSTWFANARRRLKKENKMTWTPKNRSEDDDDDDKSDISDDDDEARKKQADDKNENEDIDVGDDLDLSDIVTDPIKPIERKDKSSLSPGRLGEIPGASSHKSVAYKRDANGERIPPISPKSPTDSVTSKTQNSTTASNNNTDTITTPPKPKIWSLADIATSGSSSSSSGNNHNSTNPNNNSRIIQKELSGHPGNLQLPTLPIGQGSQGIYPSALNNLRQWVNGAYPSSAPHHPSSTAYSGLVRPVFSTGQSVIHPTFSTSTLTSPSVMGMGMSANMPRLGFQVPLPAGIPLASSEGKDLSKLHNG